MYPPSLADCSSLVLFLSFLSAHILSCTQVRICAHLRNLGTKVLQFLHICKHSGIFLPNKIKFYLFSTLYSICACIRWYLNGLYRFAFRLGKKCPPLYISRTMRPFLWRIPCSLSPFFLPFRRIGSRFSSSITSKRSFGGFLVCFLPSFFLSAGLDPAFLRLLRPNVPSADSLFAFSFLSSFSQDWIPLFFVYYVQIVFGHFKSSVLATSGASSPYLHSLSSS